MRGLAMAAFTALIALTAVARAECIDVRTAKTFDFSGSLAFRIFPGPPGFADVRKGDTPEPAYILDNDEPICLTGDPDFTDPTRQFRDIQLVPRDATAGAMRALIGQRVFVSVSEPMPAMTGHHHAPLVAWVDSIEKAQDITAEYETAATVVRGFYLALSAGSGDEAAQFVLPELRKGNFAPAALTAFYGALAEPLRLVSLDPQGPNAFLVRYAFLGRAGRCEGRAMVTTTMRGGRAYIAGIRALDGC